MTTQTRSTSESSSLVFPPRSLLVTMDFSENALAGLELARLLAGKFECRVEVVHVDPGPPAALSQGADSPRGKAALRRYYQELQYRVDGFSSSLRRASNRIMDGDPFEIIPRLAAAGSADMIVMGTHGHAGLSHLTKGSLAETAVHRSSAPVLTARFMPPPGWPSRILVPMKWTSYADRALLAARDWAQEFKADLVALHVFETEEPDTPDAGSLREHVSRLLGDQGPSPGWLIRTGNTAEEILRAAEGGRYDLIVLAAHARDFWHDTLLGTTAERVLRHASVPVLSIPIGKQPLIVQAPAG